MGNWDALNRYTEDETIDIDNREAETALRGTAIARKTGLFLGRDRGGGATAIHYSLIQGARRHGFEPLAYLRGVLLGVTTAAPADLGELLPNRRKTPLQSCPPPTVRCIIQHHNASILLHVHALHRTLAFLSKMCRSIVSVLADIH